jgi:hypothetical protein
MVDYAMLLGESTPKPTLVPQAACYGCLFQAERLVHLRSEVRRAYNPCAAPSGSPTMNGMERVSAVLPAPGEGNQAGAEQTEWAETGRDNGCAGRDWHAVEPV